MECTQDSMRINCPCGSGFIDDKGTVRTQKGEIISSKKVWGEYRLFSYNDDISVKKKHVPNLTDEEFIIAQKQFQEEVDDKMNESIIKTVRVNGFENCQFEKRTNPYTHVFATCLDGERYKFSLVRIHGKVFVITE